MAFSANDTKLSQTSDTMFSGYLDPEQSRDYFAEAEKTSIVQRFATKIPMGPTGVKIPHWTGDVSASWVGESEMKPITKGNLSSQTVVPHKIATIFTASAEVVRSNPAGYLNTMRTKVATAIAMAFDEAVLHGTSTPFAQYLDQTTKVQHLGTNLYNSIAVSSLAQLVNDGKKWNATLLDDTVEPLLNGSLDNNGRPLFIESPFGEQVGVVREGRIVGRPTIISDHVASGHNLGYAGDFSQIVWGQVGGLSYSVSNEATINYGTAESPTLISLWQHNLVAVMVEAEFGLLINDTASFVRLIAGPLDYTLAVAGDGTFTLLVNGKTTTALAEDANAATIKAAIVAVDDGITASDVVVTGTTGDWEISIPATLAKGVDTGSTVSVVTAV